ncbi:hypothetical protein OJF2_74390 [Aquisphaera giovannonii]|uniref:Uncharacterized protein n=1 Tax=Aquisphaera giovannonii TaxID=406548 RepID=A0A5B9WEZ7_9BACT|nr:hypothetical protein [Aquisphaera giovannonii]QEH38829.1 hypothetical protein OJF2_74390 [Aquisphaera giovannonii]
MFDATGPALAIRPGLSLTRLEADELDRDDPEFEEGLERLLV